MAAEVGVSQSAVSRIWRAFGLQPHRQDFWKLSKDPQFIDEVRDVVGLCLDPPEHAVVLCVMRSRRSKRWTELCRCCPAPRPALRTTTSGAGTSSLYAALDLTTGKAISSLHARHRAIEFKKFLQTPNREVPADLAVHVMPEIASTHKTRRSTAGWPLTHGSSCTPPRRAHPG